MYGRRPYTRRRRYTSRRRYSASKRSRFAMVRQVRPTGVGTRAPFIWRFPIPRRALCLHTYNVTLAVNLPATSDTAYYYYFAANDIFNPSPDASTFRAQFWDEMRDKYLYWTCLRSSLELTVVPPTHPINVMLIDAAGYAASGSTGKVFGDWEFEYGNKALFAPEDTEKTLKRAWSKKLLLPGNTDNVQSSASPADPEYFGIIYAQSDTAAASHTVTFNIKLTYFCEWSKPLGVEGSVIPAAFRKPGVVEPGVERRAPGEREAVFPHTASGAGPSDEHAAPVQTMMRVPSPLDRAMAADPRGDSDGDSDTEDTSIGHIGGALAAARPFDANAYLFGTHKK